MCRSQNCYLLPRHDHCSFIKCLLATAPRNKRQISATASTREPSSSLMACPTRYNAESRVGRMRGSRRMGGEGIAQGAGTRGAMRRTRGLAGVHLVAGGRHVLGQVHVLLRPGARDRPVGAAQGQHARHEARQVVHLVEQLSPGDPATRATVTSPGSTPEKRSICLQTAGFRR